jgi:glutamate synthase domain-containing protein 1
MCGIVGLFLKDPSLEPRMGEMLTAMLVTMSDRGPDSAGVAIYGAGEAGRAKLTVQADAPEDVFATLANDLTARIGAPVRLTRNDTHAVLHLDGEHVPAARAVLREMPGLRIMSDGDRIEIYKEVGLPRDVAERFKLPEMSGTHGIGHTRMATESAVTTEGAHPFSTGADQCLVHNGSLANHNALRRKLQRDGVRIESENDTEVGAAYDVEDAAGRNPGRGAGMRADRSGRVLHLRRGHQGRLRRGARSDRLQARRDGRDRPIRRLRERIPRAGQPAGIEDARVWEPEPATVYFWTH